MVVVVWGWGTGINPYSPSSFVVLGLTIPDYYSINASCEKPPTASLSFQRRITRSTQLT